MLAIWTCACASGDLDAPHAPIPAPFKCTSSVQQRYNPGDSKELETFPDDLLAPPSAGSPTGRAIATTDANARWLLDMPKLVGAAADDLQGLSGFALNADILLRFDGAMAAPADNGYGHHDGLRFVALTADGAAEVPCRVTLLEEGRALLIRPLRPLAPATQHAVVIQRKWQAADGGCAAPSPYLQSLLNGTATDPDGQRMVAQYAKALQKMALTPAHVSAATVFTTHDELSAMVQFAAMVSQQELAWDAAVKCDKESKFQHCERRFQAMDYRLPSGRIAASAGVPMQLPVSIWLPLQRDGAVPVVLHAHGMNSNRGGGKWWAEMLCPLGFAVVAVDAVHHGEHPTRDPEAGLPGLLFLGMDIGKLAIDPKITRGSFNQTTADRLQLLRLLALHPDVDDQPGDDIDPSRVAYHGISLGALLGPQLLALSPQISAAVLSVGGGRLLEFATSTVQVKSLISVLHNLAGSKQRFERLLPVAQTLMDSADPASWAPHVFHQRLVGAGQEPHVLFPVALHDQTVPPPTARALARALRIPHVQPIAAVVEGLQPTKAPTAANVANGQATAGYFQLDRCTVDGKVVKATHANAPGSDEGAWQIRHFLQTWRDDDAAEIGDPYAALGTEPLKTTD